MLDTSYLPPSRPAGRTRRNGQRGEIAWWRKLRLDGMAWTIIKGREMDRRALSISGVLGLAILATIDLSSSARADRSCVGSMDGSSLQPLPNPIVVTFETPPDSTANPGLAQRFSAGLQSAGVAVAPEGQGNTRLSMTFLLAPSATAGAGAPSGTYSDFSWVSGETAPGEGQRSIRGETLSISAEATNTASQSLAWIGSFTCTITTTDPNVLAQDLGNIVVHSLRSSGAR
jgi:hypothetical protein